MPSANLGKDMAMFEAVHGSAPDIAGKGIANPTALLWSACMMLDYISLSDYAEIIRRAVDKVMMDGVFTTPDIGGESSTMAYTSAIIHEVKRIMEKVA